MLLIVFYGSLAEGRHYPACYGEVSCNFDQYGRKGYGTCQHGGAYGGYGQAHVADLFEKDGRFGGGHGDDCFHFLKFFVMEFCEQFKRFKRFKKFKSLGSLGSFLMFELLEPLEPFEP
jgi:hypothetical protein